MLKANPIFDSIRSIPGFPSLSVSVCRIDLLGHATRFVNVGQ